MPIRILFEMQNAQAVAGEANDFSKDPQVSGRARRRRRRQRRKLPGTSSVRYFKEFGVKQTCTIWITPA
jgi:hypothetical protein